MGWTVLGLVLASGAWAQDAKTGQDGTGTQHRRLPVEPSVETERTFFLHNARTQADQNELLTALRNLLGPETRIFLVPGQAAIVMEGQPDQMALLEKMLRDLDLPRKVYRLTYTLTETDGGKRLGVQHYSMEVEGGLRSQLKQGNRVPLVTGTVPVKDAASLSSQVTYIDVGVNLDATVDSLDNGVGLRTKVELSSVAGDLSSTLAADPVLRQTTFEGTSVLTLGKPVELGGLDSPGSTRHTQVEVVAELVK